MERELNPRRNINPGVGLPPDGIDLDQVRSKGESMLGAADKIMDATMDTVAEEYLQQSRQRGAQ